MSIVTKLMENFDEKEIVTFLSVPKVLEGIFNINAWTPVQ